VVEVGPHFHLACEGIVIPVGARVAVIGANGAGKSTLIEALLGMRTASTANVELLGRPLADFRRTPSLRTRLGVQIQNVFYPRDVPVSEIVRLHDALHGGDRTGAGNLFDIERLKRRAFGQLSQGERQRVHLYAALAHGADLVFLDEPATGLDRRYAQRLYGAWFSGLGPTVIMATHDAAALEACTHTLWLANGQAKRFGLTTDLIADLLGAFRIEVRVTPSETAERRRDWLQRSLAPTRTVCRDEATSLVLFCQTRPGDEVQRKLQEDFGGFAVATTGPGDLLALAAEER
jgi:ABC-2 type transport system ATP-binding protein